MGVDVGVIEKKGAYFTYGEMRLGQGRENAKAFLKENPSILEEITQKTRQNMTALSTKAFGAMEPTVQEKDDALSEDH
jgi:recombination protein RecA